MPISSYSIPMALSLAKMQQLMSVVASRRSQGESIRFEDGEYSAVNLNESTLSINLPLGVQLGENPGRIEVTGSGSELFFNEFGEPDLSTKVAGLTNSSINLTAGDITINGGNVTAPQLNLTATSGTIEILNGGSLDGAGGTARVNAQNLIIRDGSAIVAINEGDAPSGEIDINVSESVNVVGESADFPSFISTDNAFEALNNGGNTSINANSLTVAGGAVISASSYSEASGGAIEINASQVDVNGGGAFASSLAVRVGRRRYGRKYRGRSR